MLETLLNEFTICPPAISVAITPTIETNATMSAYSIVVAASSSFRNGINLFIKNFTCTDSSLIIARQ